MKERNEKETENKVHKFKRKWGGEKRFYLITALCSALAMIAIVVIAVAVSGTEPDIQAGNNGNSSVGTPDSTPDDGNGGQDVIVTPEGMVLPMETVSIVNDYGFYHNKTLNTYYEHAGLDFAAEAGSAVLAVDGGVVESIYKEDLLSGTEIVIDHGDGVKSVYRFVTEAEGLAVGDTVEKGETIATVAEANGNEYKDGAHLHFEILKSGVAVDPNEYLSLDEK